MNRATLFCQDRAFFVNRITNNVHDTTKCRVTNWHLNCRICVGHFLTTNETFSCVHSDTAHCVFTKVLCHFHGQHLAVVVCCQRVQNLWQVVTELHVNDGADDLDDLAFSVCHKCFLRLERFRARNNFNQLVGDLRLTRAVKLDGQLVDHVTSVACRVVHC